MKTKIVYIAISNDKDIYLEQIWASAYSLKCYTPNAHVVILTDEVTKENIMSSERRKILSVVDEIIAVSVEGDYSNMEKSRWLKTNFRSILSGDLLFIDSDTIVTGDLSEVDYFDCSVGATLDLHCHFENGPYAAGVRYIMQKIYNQELKQGTEYFNSGIIYVKDDDNAHHFFNKWHENWKYSLSKGVRTDQQSLIKTCNDLGNLYDIGGAYNCQILGSIEYLYDAKIIHFFNTKWGQPTFSPFFEKDIYYEIKKNRGVTPETDDLIRHCKQTFDSPTIPISHEDVFIWHSTTFKFLRWSYINHKLLFKGINFVFRTLFKVLRINKKIRNKLTNVNRGGDRP